MRRAYLGSLLALAGVLVVTGTAGVSTAAAPGEVAGLDYVALGDSYSAGFGLTPYSDTSPFAGSPNGCYQAEANYPHRVASSLGLNLVDETCSGAISANLGYPTGTTFPIPVSADPLPELPEDAEVQVTLSGLTAPALQNAGLSADTDIVTVAIGGNDLGFADIATACIRDSVDSDSAPLYLYYKLFIDVSNCEEYFGEGSTYLGADLYARMSSAVAPRIDGTFEAIKQLAPNAQVFVVGYPQIAPADATDACFTSMDNDNAVPFSGVDLEFINSVESVLDAALQSSADTYGFHFVPTWAGSAGNTLCSSDPWIFGLTAYVNLSSSCDPGYLPEGDGYVCIALGALHPNESGVAYLAASATSAISAAFHVTPSSASAEPGKSTTITGGGFQPGETVRLLLGTGPSALLLGTTVADAAGSFSATVAVPGSAPVGAQKIYGVGVTSERAFSAPLEIARVIAATGVDGMPVLVFGGAMVLLGVALVGSARKRRA